MNKIVSIALLMIATHSITAITTNKIDKAIEDSSVSKLKSALRGFEREEMTPEMRMKYLKDFSQAAADLIEQREESCSIVGNWQDIAKAATGGVLALVGSFMTYSTMNFGDLFSRRGQAPMARRPFGVEDQSFIGSWPEFAGGLAVLTGGCYLLYKGLTCSTQKAQIAQAQAIEELLLEKLATRGGERVPTANNTSEDKRAS